MKSARKLAISRRISHGILVMASLLILPVQAELPRIGQPLAAVTIDRGGEIIVGVQGVQVRPWHTATLTGQVQLIIHVAGRLTAKHQLGDLIAQLSRTPFTPQAVHFITLVNTNDALFGSAPFVERSIISSKKDSPNDSFIIDRSGIAAHRWQLQPESAAIIILDRQEKVVFFHQGQLNSSINRTIIQCLQQLAAK